MTYRIFIHQILEHHNSRQTFILRSILHCLILTIAIFQDSLKLTLSANLFKLVRRREYTFGLRFKSLPWFLFILMNRLLFSNHGLTIKIRLIHYSLCIIIPRAETTVNIIYILNAFLFKFSVTTHITYSFILISIFLFFTCIILCLFDFLCKRLLWNNRELSFILINFVRLNRTYAPKIAYHQLLLIVFGRFRFTLFRLELLCLIGKWS